MSVRISSCSVNAGSASWKHSISVLRRVLCFSNAHSCTLALLPALLHAMNGRPPRSGVSLSFERKDVCVPGKKEGEFQGISSVNTGSTNEVLREKCHPQTLGKPQECRRYQK